ncbi:MAG: tyrosine-type recombinase/integrase [Polyangiaceae bacterium]|nr:tyrosine-type recombinase/integrase [Polyangiaceae bacterium]
MPKRATGSVTFGDDGIARTRVTLQGQNRRVFELPSCKTEQQALDRSELLAEQAKRLRKAGHTGSKAADTLLLELARARPGAEAVALQVIGELCGGVAVPAKKDRGPTFRNVAEEWISGALSTRFPDNVDKPTEAWGETCRRRLESAIYPVVGDTPIGDITREDCEQVMRQLPVPKGRERLQATTRRQYAGLLTRVLNLAVVAGYLTLSPLPANWLPKPSKRKRFPILLPNEDATLLSRNQIPLVWRLFYGFLHREGMRREEAVKLTWADIDLENNQVTLDENKTSHPRWWNLDDGTADALRAWRAMQDPKPEPPDCIFQESGVPLPLDHMAEKVRADLRRAGLKRADLYSVKDLKGAFGIHCFRRSFVTQQLARGTNEDFVRRRTGHKTDELLRYRQDATELARGGLRELSPLGLAIPELNDSPRESPRTTREGGGTGRRARFRF